MHTMIVRTRQGFHGAVTFNGKVIAMTLGKSDRNRAAVAGVQLLRSVSYSDRA